MTRTGILGATALSLSLAVASPAMAQHMRGGTAVHASGGANFGGMRGGGSVNAGSQANFRGANASVARPATTTAGPNVATARTGGERFVDREFRGDRDRGFGAGAGFVAGLAAGSALGYGYGYGYDPYYYGDDYAYYDGGYYEPGYVVSQAVVPDASSCAARYRSYDPTTGTYLGFDGLRHPCL